MMRTPTSLATQAFTLVESSIATAICALFLGSVFTMNMSSMETIRCAKESAAASQVLQQRLESLRIANWHQVTDADWLSANLLNADALGSTGLKNLSETLTLVPYDSTSTTNTQLIRTSAGTSISTRNSNLLAENAIKVIWTLNYTGAPNDRPISRQIVAILAKGGVAK